MPCRTALACQVSPALFVDGLLDFRPALLQDNNGMIIGAEAKDNLSGKKMHVYAKQVINATGPFTDSVRQMSDPSKPSIIMPSAGMQASPHLIATKHIGEMQCNTAGTKSALLFTKVTPGRLIVKTKLLQLQVVIGLTRMIA